VFSTASLKQGDSQENIKLLSGKNDEMSKTYLMRLLLIEDSATHVFFVNLFTCDVP
jgi:hypothetical protein